jgi:hypothetical protein
MVIFRIFFIQSFELSVTRKKFTTKHDRKIKFRLFWTLQEGSEIRKAVLAQNRFIYFSIFFQKLNPCLYPEFPAFLVKLHRNLFVFTGFRKMSIFKANFRLNSYCPKFITFNIWTFICKKMSKTWSLLVLVSLKYWAEKRFLKTHVFYESNCILFSVSKPWLRPRFRILTALKKSK